MDPTVPDFTNVPLPFEPASYWRPGDFDAAALVEALKAQPGLADFDDDAGSQSSVRLDADEGGLVGYWVTIPAGAAESEIDAAVAAYVAPAPTAASPADVAAAADGIVAKNLADAGIAPDDVPTVLEGFLGEAKKAISFFEQAAADPSMKSAQWTAFQALSQAQKDRLLYDLVRLNGMLLRYLTGSLRKP